MGRVTSFLQASEAPIYIFLNSQLSQKVYSVMTRKNTLASLKDYHPTCELEERHKQEMICFLENNINCFDRTCKSGHFTASCWIENATGTHVLLMHHKKLDQWFQLGGHADGDPDLLSVALKEAQEESGLENIVPVSKDIFDVDIHFIPPYADVPEHYHYDVRFFLKSPVEAPLIINGESKDLRWFGKDSASLPTQNASILRMFEKWRKTLNP